MTRFYVEDTLKEKLKEQDLNVTNLLREYIEAEKHKKQKERVADSIMIYRLRYAPERQIFYVDIGNLPNHRAMAYLEKIKNEIKHRDIKC